MAGKLGYGIGFSWNGNTVGNLNSIPGPNMTATSVDVTTHDSPDGYMEFVQGLIDAGEVPVAGNFKPDDTNGQVAMLTDFNNRQERTCVITLPNSIATWTFTGFLTAYAMGEATTDGAIPFSATVKITGKPVLAVATSTGLTTPFFSISESADVTPAASGSVYDYVAVVATGISSVTVTPTASAGVIKVNGNIVATGVASSAIPLGAAGSLTTITITVTETNKAPKIYTIKVLRESA